MDTNLEAHFLTGSAEEMLGVGCIVKTIIKSQKISRVNQLSGYELEMQKENTLHVAYKILKENVEIQSQSESLLLCYCKVN